MGGWTFWDDVMQMIVDFPFKTASLAILLVTVGIGIGTLIS
jgi:hypothetical protein